MKHGRQYRLDFMLSGSAERVLMAKSSLPFTEGEDLEDVY
jgi:hypothetical protein